MDNFLDQKTFIDNQEVWAERLIKAIEDKTVNHYFTGQSDKDQKGVSWSFYGLFDSDNLSGHVVIVAYFREKSWIVIKESDLFHPHMRDRIWGPDISDIRKAETLSQIMWEYIKVEIKNDLEKDSVEDLPKH